MEMNRRSWGGKRPSSEAVAGATTDVFPVGRWLVERLGDG